MAKIHGMREPIALGQDVVLDPTEDLVDRVTVTRQWLVEALSELSGGATRGHWTLAVPCRAEVPRDHLDEQRTDTGIAIAIGPLEGFDDVRISHGVTN